MDVLFYKLKFLKDNPLHVLKWKDPGGIACHTDFACKIAHTCKQNQCDKQSHLDLFISAHAKDYLLDLAILEQDIQKSYKGIQVHNWNQKRI